MGRKNKSLVYQIEQIYTGKLAIGQSKQEAKILGTDHLHIYSWETYHSYLQHANAFAKWCKALPEGQQLRTVEACRPYVEAFLQHSIDRKLSPYTIKLQASALAKLYGCRTTDFDIKTPARERKNIKRSRGKVKNDVKFNEELHKDLVTFCRCTGLRNGELRQIRGEDLFEADGRYYLNVTRGTKGGRPRTSPIYGSADEIQKVIELCNAAGHKKVFKKVNDDADVHSYRSDYATRVYNDFKRPLKEIGNERVVLYKNHIVDVYRPRGGRRDQTRHPEIYTSDLKPDGTLKLKPGYRDVPGIYYCRKDLKDVAYDRLALLMASAALGHNRDCVVAQHYIRA